MREVPGVVSGGDSDSERWQCSAVATAEREIGYCQTGMAYTTAERHGVHGDARRTCSNGMRRALVRNGGGAATGAEMFCMLLYLLVT